MALREMAVLQCAHDATGLIEDKEVQLRGDGIYAEAAAIFSEYLDVATSCQSDIEALKRAVFLGWYDEAEPGWNTGIEDLPTRDKERALGLLERARQEGSLDDEFVAMLGWYWTVAEWHFAAHASQPLIDYLSGLEPTAWERFDFSRESLHSRGQMGDYWLSILGRA